MLSPDIALPLVVPTGKVRILPFPNCVLSMKYRTQVVGFDIAHDKADNGSA